MRKSQGKSVFFEKNDQTHVWKPYIPRYMLKNLQQSSIPLVLVLLLLLGVLYFWEKCENRVSKALSTLVERALEYTTFSKESTKSTYVYVGVCLWMFSVLFLNV
jgi:hypothetical protein